jgi:hypothetical protein
MRNKTAMSVRPASAMWSEFLVIFLILNLARRSIAARVLVE